MASSKKIAQALAAPQGVDKAKRISVSLAPYGINATKGTPPRSMQDRIEDCFRRFEMMTQALIPQDWDEKTWSVIVLGLQYVDSATENQAWATLLGWGFHNGIQAKEELGVDVEQLARELREGGILMNLAVVEMVVRYWQMPQEYGHEMRLELLGLVEKKPAKMQRAKGEMSREF